MQTNRLADFHDNELAVFSLALRRLTDAMQCVGLDGNIVPQILAEVEEEILTRAVDREQIQKNKKEERGLQT